MTVVDKWQPPCQDFVILRATLEGEGLALWTRDVARQREVRGLSCVVHVDGGCLVVMGDADLGGLVGRRRQRDG